jgi:hypothetical protein
VLLPKHVLEIEAELRKLPPTLSSLEDAPFHATRRALAAALLAQLEPTLKGHSLPDLIVACSKAKTASRSAALLVLRALGRPGIIPPSDSVNQLDRKLVDLAQAGASDFCKAYKVDTKQQGFEKADVLRTIHGDICTKLDILRVPLGTLEAIISTRQAVQKVLNAQIVAAYLQPFDHQRVTIFINALYSDIKDLLDTEDHTFLPKLQALRRTIEEHINWAKSSRTFLTEEYIGPFLEAASNAVDHAEASSSSRFRSEIAGAGGDKNFALEKRYPLRDTKRVSKIAIPLINKGPGIATNVRAAIATPSDALLGSAEVNLGEIPPGRFALAVEVWPSRPLPELKLQIEVSWSYLANTERLSEVFTVLVRSQASEVDWAELEKREPYSTSPAEGSEFVGRREKVQTLSSRLLRDRMQSSYITGQKRVGKSSLALAVRDELQKQANVASLYLEYGEISDVDPLATMRNLGMRLADFLVKHLPPALAPSGLDFSGSLAPLSRICDTLLSETPNQRFVIILDEFDELPPEIYRPGPLAETFFSNLRTLAAKRNLAFMLIGGENMPFIVEAQGDQLNKFVREGLSYFSRVDDWSDFRDLVRGSVRADINWTESATNEIYTLTSGHPYYAKLLCARVYSTAVTERDTEVTTEEVRRAFAVLVSSLDTNSFAHLWKDGLTGTRGEVESNALQRCRLLVAMGRILRAKKPVTERSINENKHTIALAGSSITPILRDFCRREILTEQGGVYTIGLPLFREWLAQSGVTSLIGDTLRDELAAGLQQSEDAAYVHDDEIQRLTDAWPLYRGHVVSVDEVRRWLHQAPLYREQRMLFKLLKNLRFFSEIEIREKLALAHSLVAQSLPGFARKGMADRRRDVLVTYVDGPAKSGHYYASRYAEQNLLPSECVKEMTGFEIQLLNHEEKTGTIVNGVIIVDDIVGTGRSLASNVSRFVDSHRELLAVRNLAVVIVVVCATPDGERYLREVLAGLPHPRIELRICEPLSPQNFAFRHGNGVWETFDEESEAKALCTRLGAQISRNAPLGYVDQGLLVVFPDTCPNNSLPILHGESSREGAWQPLFRRPLG